MSEYTPPRLVVVGVNLLGGDMQATLTWNTTADIDLHVVEPSGTEVYYANRVGQTAELDRDDTNGFGPENIYVRSGARVPGIYRVFIIHFAGAGPTTATISITVNPGSAHCKQPGDYATNDRRKSTLAIEVANVNVVTGEITEVAGSSMTSPALWMEGDTKRDEPDPPPPAPLIVRPPQ